MTVVCIAGMHRSGTSMVARTLNLCGLYLGPAADTPPPVPDNPEGHWENSRFVALNEQVLARLHSGWDFPPRPPTDWIAHSDLSPLQDQAIELIQSFVGHPLWGWKDPRNSLTLPFWKHLMPDLKVIICLRHPLQVAQSLQWRGNSSIPFGLDLWLTYNQQLLAVVRPDQYIVTHYESYFHDPSAELRRVLDWLGLPAAESDIDQARATVKQALRHYQAAAADFAPDAPPALQTLYQQMCAEAGPVYATASRAPQRTAEEDRRPQFNLVSYRQTAQVKHLEEQLQQREAVIASLQEQLHKFYLIANTYWRWRNRLRRLFQRPLKRASTDHVLNLQQFPPISSGDGNFARDFGKVSIIIVSYNGPSLIRQCLESILADASYPNYQVVIVDNASEEPVRDYLRHLQETERRIRVIFNETNLGFAAANNIGLQHLGDSEFIVLLNNDTVVPPGWLGRLLRHARRPEAGLVGPVTNWTGNEAKIDVTYTKLQDMAPFAKTYTQAHEGQYFEIKMLAMYCIAMRRAVFEQIGPLDERFGLGMFEDEDYARRVKQAGFQMICAEDVFVHHYGMSSFSKLLSADYEALFERNKRLYEEKWGERWEPHRYRPGLK